MILRADARHLPIADNCVQCCVTSPPYFGLRSYAVEGNQIGMEKTPEAYIATILEALTEVWRVLRDDGTLWLNLGDSYAGSWGAQSREHAGKHGPNISALSANQLKAAQRRESGTGSIPAGSGLKPKDLMMIPARVALAAQAAGWYLRSDIIWAKPNPMPESVQDRPTSSHEHIFLLTKSERYYYDAAAIREQRVQDEDANGFRGGSYVGGNINNETAGKRATIGNKKVPSGWNTSPGRHDVSSGEFRADKQRGHSRRHDGFNDRWDSMSKDEQGSMGRNKRNVWTIATRPYPEAHYATFPPDIPEICIRAGSKPGDLILDPFFGSGTVGMVAEQLGRKWIGCDLGYQDLQKKRVRNVQRQLVEATA